MPRRVRDYRAEYQRRVALERSRAAAENRPFNMGRARGHGNDDIAWLIRKSSPYNVEGMTDKVEEAQENGVSRREIIEMLRAKKEAYEAKRHGDPTIGHNRWNADQRRPWLPEFFYYNGQ